MSLCGHIYFGNIVSYDINVTENLNSCIHQLHRLTNCILKSNKLLKLKEKNSNLIQKHLLHLKSAENENHIDVQRLYTCKSVFCIYNHSKRITDLGLSWQFEILVVLHVYIKFKFLFVSLSE